MLDTLDAAAVRRWCGGGLAALRAHQHEIDELNVYPVPDGDTGTNLVLTMTSAQQALEQDMASVTGEVLPAGSGPAGSGAGGSGAAGGPGGFEGGAALGEADPGAERAALLGRAMRRMARGALLGARGNSGVIVSQILRGMADTFSGTTVAVRGAELARALRVASEAAYAAVARPVEGTVLSVVAAAAEGAAKLGSDDLLAVAKAAARSAAEALARTPQQLPILARAGVVDAGGRGLVLLLEALVDALPEPAPTQPSPSQPSLTEGAPTPPSASPALPSSTPPSPTPPSLAEGAPAQAAPGGESAFGEGASAGAASAAPGPAVPSAGPAVPAVGPAVPAEGPMVPPTGSGELPANSGEVPAVTAAPPASSGELPASSGELPAGSGELPAGSREMPAVPREMPAGQGVPLTDLGAPPAGSTIQPAGSAGHGVVAQVWEPTGSATGDAGAGLTSSVLSGGVDAAGAPIESGGFGYEVQFLLDAETEAVDELRLVLDRLGDSLVVVGTGDGSPPTWNVHVHVDDIGGAIEAGIAVGRPYQISVTRLEDRVHVARPDHRIDRGAVVVADGDGLTALFAAEGAVVVDRNPSIAELLDAIGLIGARSVVLLPNDANTHAVASSAAREAAAVGVRVSVVPTRSPVQALAALAVRDPQRVFDDDVIAMAEAAGACRYGEVCTASREALTVAGRCLPGDLLGLVDGEVHVIGADLGQICRRLLDRMLGGGGDLVTLVLGADAPDSLEEDLRGHLAQAWPFAELHCYAGGQPRYHLLVGVE